VKNKTVKKKNINLVALFFKQKIRNDHGEVKRLGTNIDQLERETRNVIRFKSKCFEFKIDENEIPSFHTLKMLTPSGN